MKGFLSNLFGGFMNPWWVEISTADPKCLYYFGPFETESEAILHKDGYIEDLEQEGAQQIIVEVKRCAEPEQLTVIYSDSTAMPAPVFSN